LPLSLPRDAPHRGLLSFPTRRSSDLIYAEYQNRLREHNLVDREGEGWLALDVMEKQPHIGRNVDLLLVDGYDQFTPLQASLLMRSEEHTSELQSRENLVCRLLLEEKN